MEKFLLTSPNPCQRDNPVGALPYKGIFQNVPEFQAVYIVHVNCPQQPFCLSVMSCSHATVQRG